MTTLTLLVYDHIVTITLYSAYNLTPLPTYLVSVTFICALFCLLVVTPLSPLGTSSYATSPVLTQTVTGSQPLTSARMANNVASVAYFDESGQVWCWSLACANHYDNNNYSNDSRCT